METSSTKQDTVTKTVGLARAAIAAFILERDLPRPVGIRRPRRTAPGSIFVDVHSGSGEVEAWVEATEADYLCTEVLNHEGNRYARVSWQGHVPTAIGSITVIVRITQRVNQRLALIPDGAAS